MKKKGEKRVTPNEAAKLLGVSAKRVRAWCDSGELPSYTSVHQWRMIDRNELIAFARRHPEIMGHPTTAKSPSSLAQ
jgi:excisionase family DNA binding protein